MAFVCLDKELIPKDSICIFGVASKGNIGQIAVDVLLARLTQENNVRRLGYIESEYVPPVFGCDFDGGNTKQICMPIEVYRVVDTNHIIVQQRSPCWSGGCQLLAAQIIRVLAEVLQISTIYVLSGCIGVAHSNPVVGDNPTFPRPIKSGFLISVGCDASEGISRLEEEFEVVPLELLMRGQCDPFDNFDSENASIVGTQRLNCVVLPKGMSMAKGIIRTAIRIRQNYGTLPTVPKLVVISVLWKGGDPRGPARDLASKIALEVGLSTQSLPSSSVIAVNEPTSWRTIFRPSLRPAATRLF